MTIVCVHACVAQGEGRQAVVRHTDATLHARLTAAMPRWGIARYYLSTSGASVADVLRDLSSATGVPIAVGAQLAGSVEGRFDLPPQRFLEVLANAYGLVWYYDGTVLHVDPTGDERSLTLRLNYAKPAELHALLNGTASADPRFPLVDDTPMPGLITVRGPAAYLALVDRSARQVDGAARMKVATAVRIVGLHYSQAADRIALTNGRTGPVEGVASEARRLLDPPGNRYIDVTEYEAPLPIIAADARTNTVLIRDRPQQLDADVRAVTALDNSAPLVELDVLIADVQTAALPLLLLGRVQAGSTGGAGGQVKVGGDGAALRDRLHKLEATQTAHVRTESELSTVDRVAAALEQRLDQPVAISGHVRPPAVAPAAMSLRIVPSVEQRTSPPGITLAVELRSPVEIDVARMTLAPHEGMVLVVPDESRASGSAQATAQDPPTIWLVMLVPHVIERSAGDATQVPDAKRIRGEVQARSQK
ncbi:hypothetical protein PQR05_08830 [Paraburkholderia sediminicola]